MAVSAGLSSQLKRIYPLATVQGYDPYNPRNGDRAGRGGKRKRGVRKKKTRGGGSKPD